MFISDDYYRYSDSVFYIVIQNDIEANSNI